MMTKSTLGGHGTFLTQPCEIAAISVTCHALRPTSCRPGGWCREGRI